MKMQLAEALLRRKELQGRLNVLEQIKGANIYEVVSTRKPAHEGIDDIVAKVPRLSLEEVTRSYNRCSRALRLVDAVIQRANWETEIEVDPIVNEDPEAAPEPKA